MVSEAFGMGKRESELTDDSRKTKIDADSADFEKAVDGESKSG